MLMGQKSGKSFHLVEFMHAVDVSEQGLLVNRQTIHDGSKLTAATQILSSKCSL